MPLFGVSTGEDGSHIPPGKDAVFCRSSGTVAATGKHDVQEIGDIWVHKIVIGPWTSQKCARDIYILISLCLFLYQMI